MNNEILKEERELIARVFHKFSYPQTLQQRNLYFIHKSRLRQDTADKFFYTNVHTIDQMLDDRAIYKYYHHYPKTRPYERQDFRVIFDFEVAGKRLKELNDLFLNIKEDPFKGSRPEVIEDGSIKIGSDTYPNLFTEFDSKKVRVMKPLCGNIKVMKQDLYLIAKDKDMPSYEDSLKKYGRTKTHRVITNVTNEINKALKKIKVPIKISAVRGEESMQLIPTPTSSRNKSK